MRVLSSSGQSASPGHTAPRLAAPRTAHPRPVSPRLDVHDRTGSIVCLITCRSIMWADDVRYGNYCLKGLVEVESVMMRRSSASLRLMTNDSYEHHEISKV